MTCSSFRRSLPILSLLWILTASSLVSQQLPDQVRFYSPLPGQRALDSLIASRIPVLSLPSDAPAATLPDSLNNAAYKWFPGILNQHSYFACQQYCGTAYTFGYEMNRLRDADGKIDGNKYPPHYMWNFFNEGEQYVGVNFLHSFHAMMEQGHMTNADYGADTSQLETGWITGYDKYYRAMKHRIRNIFSIPVNSVEGIQTLKQYLYDHLDGSSTGGIACFTASSPNGYGPFLPENTPEAGKLIQVNWLPYPTHGMAVVGYHDSIRYDINEDGQYTNDIDINGDGIVDARDWEIGGFRLANSYGPWWADQGYFYVLYHAMASEFEEGGVWNNSVYVVEPDPDYTPLLTVKIDLEHPRRNQLNILAGVSTDPEADYPDHLINPLIFSNQGGPLYMQGFDSLPEQARLEFGLDVTPLLSFLPSGSEAKFFLIVEERDPTGISEGLIHEASFIHYGTSTSEFPCIPSVSTIHNNGITILSSTGSTNCDHPIILDEALPPFTASGNYSHQFQAQGGESPYAWDIYYPYHRMERGTPYTAFDGLKIPLYGSGKPYIPVSLPFGFPYFGNSFDSIYVNAYGMIQFHAENIPYPYLCSAIDMFDNISAISPAFSWDYVVREADGDGIWVDASPDSVRFRWQLSLNGQAPQTSLEFGVTLFPSGEITFCYGPVESGENGLIIWCAISPGKKQNSLVSPIYEPTMQNGKAITYLPPAIPTEVNLTPGGLLTLSEGDTGTIYDLHIRVTDNQAISAEKSFQLSTGLLIRHELSTSSGYFQYNEPASLDLSLSNITAAPLNDLSLKFYCEEGGVSISDSLATSGTIAAGQTSGLSGAFSLILQSKLPDKTSVPCRIVATSGGKSWEYPFVLTVSAVDMQVSEIGIRDGVNALLDAGETAEMMFTLTNKGTLPAGNLSITLSSGDTFFEILSSPTLYPGTLGDHAMYPAVFTVKASRSTPPMHQVNMELLVTNGSSIEFIFPMTLSIGTRPLALLNLTSSTTTVPLMSGMLDSLQLGYDTFTSFPDNLNSYPAVFIILGTSYPGSSTLSTEETSQLIQYLKNGGHVYMESYASWYYGTASMLEEMFKFSTERVEVYYFNDMEGVNGTITEEMDYIYLGSSPYAIFEVIPKGDGFSVMTNKDAVPKCLEFAYDGPDYKTIGTFKEFGKLVDGEPPSRKAILFKRYLEFLDVNIDGPFPYFHADTTQICLGHPVQFTDDSFDNVISWQWEFPGGNPSSSQEQHPAVQYMNTGFYDVILTISDGIHTQQMHKKKYIHVNVCAAIGESSSSAARLVVYPNPASGIATVVLPEKPEGPVAAELFDIRGFSVATFRQTGQFGAAGFQLDISHINPGIYLLRISGEQAVYSTKLVVY